MAMPAAWNLAAGSDTFGTDGQVFILFRDGNLLKGLQVLFDVGP
jgi:hypothetical protein